VRQQAFAVLVRDRVIALQLALSADREGSTISQRIRFL
jgi:hypothetical protein